MKRFFKKNKIQIFRFIIVGLFSSTLNFIVYKFIFIITNNINLSAIFGYTIGLLNSFLFASKWVFSNYKYIRIDKAMIMFGLIYALGGIEMTLVINLLYEVFENSSIPWIFGACLAAINNYLFSKYFIFKN